MARNYVAAGFVCVLEGAIATRSHVLACQQAVAPHPLHLDAGYDSAKTRDELAGRGMTGQIAHKGEKAPIQAGQRWPWNGPTPGITPSAGCNAATSGAKM
jgi:hypothetical protein